MNSLFVRQFFQGNKKLLKLAEVRLLGHVPTFPELTVSGLLTELRSPADIMAYIPDGISLPKLDRKYVLTVN